MGKLGLTKKGKISISIEKPPSAAGEVVHGIIQVSISEPIRCDAVVLKTTGKEKMSWDQPTGEDLRAESFQRKYDYFDEK
ncbi:hypothetical protein Poli38472_008344 [Pythium oligandrum]|uniref:Arrestin-like N-terminal domain-containing protein n=1 Tax=Pythium oligandrum TaxID=41045 RepID=A0A8K1FNB7_PYTOL|nr:hypothetical protein Poli38472_008344 [Pythium oligandrum]|eukprot:TMW65702.1 hypothetical protein Poli38472_008344 [Pythium oligandrum]